MQDSTTRGPLRRSQLRPLRELEAFTAIVARVRGAGERQ